MAENQHPSCPVDGCGCVGYAYVPIQFLQNTYSTEKALTQGTLFPELDLTIDEYGKICKASGGISDE